jgi:hypothetical protein
MHRIAAVALVACSSKPDPPKPVPVTPSDAAVVAVSTEPGGLHDEVASHAPPLPASHPGRPIDIVLRSTPPNAEVAIDGVPHGTTPTYWSGTADGRPHEFTFVLPRHAVARYRFVPVVSGVVHARLEPIAEEPDGGLPPEVVRPSPIPEPAADAATPPPLDAAPRVGPVP